MPPEPTEQRQEPKTSQQLVDAKTLQQLVADVGLYPAEAYQFVQEGLGHTVRTIHANITDAKASRHVSGQQLCDGLRDLALAQWGLLARTVLERWNITCTLDFGRIVFALIEVGQMQRTDEDTLDDFRNVFDFETVLDKSYRITLPSPAEGRK
jgi:uncharacterized repeat protein (TIGR04138 family)